MSMTHNNMSMMQAIKDESLRSRTLSWTPQPRKCKLLSCSMQVQYWYLWPLIQTQQTSSLMILDRWISSAITAMHWDSRLNLDGTKITRSTWAKCAVIKIKSNWIRLRRFPSLCTNCSHQMIQEQRLSVTFCDISTPEWQWDQYKSTTKLFIKEVRHRSKCMGRYTNE